VQDAYLRRLPEEHQPLWLTHIQLKDWALPQL
jgi:hypothetical protein